MSRPIHVFVFLAAIAGHVAFSADKTSPKVVREIESVQQLMQCGESLQNCIVQGLDLRGVQVNWDKMDVRGAVFLGCQFDGNGSRTVVERGAAVFPALPELPYNPYRSSLYTQAELRRSYNPQNGRTLDQEVYAHFLEQGKFDPPIMEAIAQRLHDHAIDDALREHLGIDANGMPRRRVVAIMGGASTERNDAFFREVALLAHLLTREGFYVSTGGGPGMMEAGNLGAYLANYETNAVTDAVSILAQAPKTTSPKYQRKADEVLRKYPKGRESLAIPTWFYGHEPSNFFGSHVAKYFSNGIREDVLLSTAIHGVVFAPGSAGTSQEVFMDAAQNYYGTFGYFSPMAFLGVKRYIGDTTIYPTLRGLARGKEYEKFLVLSDDPQEIVRFIRTHPPEKAPEKKP